jgi:hypothetical protein
LIRICPLRSDFSLSSLESLCVSCNFTAPWLEEQVGLEGDFGEFVGGEGQFGHSMFFKKKQTKKKKKEKPVFFIKLK